MHNAGCHRHAECKRMGANGTSCMRTIAKSLTEKTSRMSKACIEPIL
jgi:hypothetical protein